MTGRTGQRLVDPLALCFMLGLGGGGRAGVRICVAIG